MPIKQIMPGVWVVPEIVESIVAFGPSEEFGQPMKPGVRMKLNSSEVKWGFDTYEGALEFCDKLAARILEPEKKHG